MRNSYEYISFILTALFSAEERRFAKAFDRLSEENQQLIGHRLDGFMYQGAFYRHSQALAGSGERRTLHLNLWPGMQDILRDRDEVERDRALMRQILFKLLEPCTQLQEIRDAIPECIVDAAPPEIAAMQRQNNGVGWINNPRDIKLYNKMLPKMEFYSAARLMY